MLLFPLDLNLGFGIPERLINIEARYKPSNYAESDAKKVRFFFPPMCIDYARDLFQHFVKDNWHSLGK